MKEHLSPLPEECGEKNYSPLPVQCGEKNYSPLPVECGEKIFSPRPPECCEEKIFTAKIANLKLSYLKFTRNIFEVSDRWLFWLRSWWHAGGEWFEPVYGSFFFVTKPVNAVKRNFSPLNSTQIFQKITAFTAFNAKRCGRFAVKKVFFHRYSPLILHFC